MLANAWRKKVRLRLFTSLIKRKVSRYLHAVVVKWWQRNVDKTIRCKCKVVDLLIKLIDWPYCASRIRRRSWLAVVSSTLSQLLVAFYVLRTPVYIWNRIAKYMHFILFVYPWRVLKAHFSIMSPKIRCQARHLREKYSQICKIQLTGKRIFHKGDQSAHQVVWIRLMTGKPWICSCIALFYDCFSQHFLAVGGHCTASTSGGFANIWQSRRVGIIAIKNKRTRIHF